VTSHKDYYETLEINPHADRRGIAEAYERLSRQLQPSDDAPPSDPQRMRELDEAFDILDDPARRAEYDRLRSDPGASALDMADEASGETPFDASAAEPGPPRNWLALGLLGAGVAAFVAALVVLALVIFGGGGERTVTLESGLVYTEFEEGSGAGPPSPGDALTVHYTGTLEDGTEFDTSRDGNPFVFFLGQGEVIEGWDLGFASMKEGGHRKLTIPPGLAYGAEGAPPDIPANATINFDVELLQIDTAGQQVETDSGLTYVDLEIGRDPRTFQAITPKDGDQVTVHYTGRLEDGTVFADSQAEGNPRLFVLGSGSEIDGFDEGVSTMRAGGLRRLIIPPELGYGNTVQDFIFQGEPITIPPGSTLIFEVKLVSIQPS
jgi:FKBP-type peptidyl-prolyl cis-trans isomerase